MAAGANAKAVKSAAARWPARLAWTGVALALLATAWLRAGGDTWWPAFVLLFGPRWIGLGLVAFSVPLLVNRARRGLVPLGVTLAIVLVGIMGWRLGPARAGIGVPKGTTLRLLEYNVATKLPVANAILAELDNLGVDVAVLVECPRNATPLPPVGAWQSRKAGELCLYSRFPIADWSVRSQDDIWLIHGKAAVARGTLVVGADTLDIGLLHLKSPRDALSELRHPTFAAHLPQLIDSVSRIRDLESGRARTYIESNREGEPLVIAGDFNTPVESRIFARWWSGFSDAFEHAGIGFGYSWHSRWHGLRIDHILGGNGVVARRTWIGPDLGSDHVPVIADLTIPAGQRTSVAR